MTVASTEENIRSFSNLAPFYDRHGWEKMAQTWGGLVTDFVVAHPPPTSSLLDLCCGTGNFLAAMHETGAFERMAGVDGNADMLDKAREKAIPGVDLHLADARSFALNARYGLVTCQYASLNYMVGDGDLEAVMGRVHAHLETGGWFLFDINTLDGYRDNWRSSVVNRPDEVMLRNGFFDEATGIALMRVEGFMRAPDGRFDRMEYIDRERSWPFQVLEGILAEAGFAAPLFLGAGAAMPRERAATQPKLFLAAQAV